MNRRHSENDGSKFDPLGRTARRLKLRTLDDVKTWLMPDGKPAMPATFTPGFKLPPEARKRTYREDIEEGLVAFDLLVEMLGEPFIWDGTARWPAYRLTMSKDACELHTWPIRASWPGLVFKACRGEVTRDVVAVLIEPPPVVYVHDYKTTTHGHDVHQRIEALMRGWKGPRVSPQAELIADRWVDQWVTR